MEGESTLKLKIVSKKGIMYVQSTPIIQQKCTVQCTASMEGESTLKLKVVSEKGTTYRTYQFSENGFVLVSKGAENMLRYFLSFVYKYFFHFFEIKVLKKSKKSVPVMHQ